MEQTMVQCSLRQRGRKMGVQPRSLQKTAVEGWEDWWGMALTATASDCPNEVELMQALVFVP